VTTRRLGRPAFILCLSAVFVTPLVLMVLGSLRRPGLPPPDGLEVLPRVARWQNYEDATTIVPLLRQLANSVAVVAVAVPLTVLIASLAGYAIVAATPAARRRLLGVTLAALLVPASALWVPRTVLIDQLGLTDHTLSAALPALMATTPFYVLLFALSYARIPRSILESARVEGLTPLRTWAHVAFPLARPTAFAVAVLAFVFHWSNVVEPILWLSREQTWTAALGLRTLAALEPTFYPLLLAAAVMVTAPAVLAFVLAQRAFFRKTLGT
jgi:multiple sugar transport system permease protein